MPRTKYQKAIYALLTVAITVPIFVNYNIARVAGGISNSVFVASLREIPLEFACAFVLAYFVASPLANKIAFKMVDPKNDKKIIVGTVITCVTMLLMCPMMSFVSTIIYDGFSAEFIALWLQKIVINFPIAFFSQLFFVQPAVRFLFGKCFKERA